MARARGDGPMAAGFSGLLSLSWVCLVSPLPSPNMLCAPIMGVDIPVLSWAGEGGNSRVLFRGVGIRDPVAWVVSRRLLKPGVFRAGVPSVVGGLCPCTALPTGQ